MDSVVMDSILLCLYLFIQSGDRAHVCHSVCGGQRTPWRELERGEGKERGMDMMLGTRTKFSNKLKDYIKMSK